MLASTARRNPPRRAAHRGIGAALLAGRRAKLTRTGAMSHGLETRNQGHPEKGKRHNCSPLASLLVASPLQDERSGPDPRHATWRRVSRAMIKRWISEVPS